MSTYRTEVLVYLIVSVPESVQYSVWTYVTYQYQYLCQ